LRRFGNGLCERQALRPTTTVRLSDATRGRFAVLELGPEIFALLNANQQVGAKQAVIYGDGGLSLREIQLIEAELGFHFPDDFAFLLQNVRDPGSVLFPWSSFNKSAYDDAIRWVLEGIEFSVEADGFWQGRWGPRPQALPEALEIVRGDFATWPKLLPLYGHRFLAAEPCRSNNPVFSIMGTDIICYGANLAHYLMHEFVDHDYERHTYEQDLRTIDVWSDLAS